jgi:hypothetical protein
MKNPGWQADTEKILKEINRLGLVLPSLTPAAGRAMYDEDIRPLLWKLQHSEHGNYHNVRLYLGQLRRPLELMSRKRLGSKRPVDDHVCDMIAAINKLRSVHGFNLPLESDPVK